MERFEFELPFSYSILSKWLDRIDLGMIMELIEEIGRSGGNSKADGKKSDEAGKGDNKGELIIDAT